MLTAYMSCEVASLTFNRTGPLCMEENRDPILETWTSSRKPAIKNNSRSSWWQESNELRALPLYALSSEVPRCISNIFYGITVRSFLLKDARLRQNLVTRRDGDRIPRSLAHNVILLVNQEIFDEPSRFLTICLPRAWSAWFGTLCCYRAFCCRQNSCARRD